MKIAKSSVCSEFCSKEETFQTQVFVVKFAVWRKRLKEKVPAEYCVQQLVDTVFDGGVDDVFDGVDDVFDMVVIMCLMVVMMC
jgi:hypothetical protein